MSDHTPLSCIGLGSMMMGWRLQADDALDIIAYAHDCGVNWLDTSVSYSRGLCHEIIGNCIKKLKLRDAFFIATKVGGIPKDSDPPEHIGYSYHNIIRQYELSLSQLQIDYIDLLQLHQPTKEHAFDEMLGALHHLIMQGKIKHYGICNYDAADFDMLSYSAKKLGMLAPFSHQFSYNLLDRDGKESLFSLAKKANANTISWGPLSGELLTDWYADSDGIKPNSRIDSGREKSAKQDLLQSAYARDCIQQLRDLRNQTGFSVQQLAISFLLNNSPIDHVLIGPSNLNQCKELLAFYTNCEQMHALNDVKF